MNGNQIKCVLDADPYTRRCFRGCFPIDRIPTKATAPFCFVLNSDPAGKPGQHWIAVYVDSHIAVFFDSLAQTPQFYSRALYSFLQRQHHGRVWTSKLKVQSDFSELCGQYCIHALKILARTGNPTVVYRFFTANTMMNDRKIARRFNKIIPKLKQCNLKYVQHSVRPISFI